MSARSELTRATAVRYAKASKKEKSKILDEYVLDTGFERKYAISKLNKATAKYVVKDSFRNKTLVKVVPVKKKKETRGRKKKYDQAVENCVLEVWEFFDRMCAKRLAPFLSDNADYFQQKRYFGISGEIAGKLKSISPATIGRILKKRKSETALKGLSMTSSKGSINLNSIPVRVFFSWDEKVPGFFECDTVANCGASGAGQFISTLTLTDVGVGWVENRALPCKTQRNVRDALDDIKFTLPYPMKGLDSDNGSEFKNMDVYGWCVENNITFTRSRPYRKNDNCYVEQKNNYHVRNLVGYYRYEGKEAWQVMDDLYFLYNQLTNYFYPCMKIIEKTRTGGKVTRKYDKPASPFARLMADESIADSIKQRMMEFKSRIDLIELKKEVDEYKERLLALAR